MLKKTLVVASVAVAIVAGVAIAPSLASDDQVLGPRCGYCFKKLG